MKKTSKPIVFFGSGPVAAESLELLNNYCSIEAVITKPRADHHKGDVPVLRVAETLGLHVHTVSNKKELDDLCAQTTFKSTVGVLIDFGIIVSQAVIDHFPLGIVNSHFSVLPEWRGADPITFSILSGQRVTGVSLMLLVEKMDEGPLLAYGEYELPPDITTPVLTQELIKLSDALLYDTLQRYQNGELQAGAPQSLTKRVVSYSRKLSKEDSIIDWHKPAVDIEREIRAFIEWPKSRTILGGKEVVVTKSHVIDTTGRPGSVAVIDKQLVVYCGEAALALDMLKPAGKQEMTGRAFLAGYRNTLAL